jgi:hypothetical protein
MLGSAFIAGGRTANQCMSLSENKKKIWTILRSNKKIYSVQYYRFYINAVVEPSNCLVFFIFQFPIPLFESHFKIIISVT